MRRLALAAGSYYRYVILRKTIGNTCVCALGNSKKTTTTMTTTTTTGF